MNCSICPRKCPVDRSVQSGFCTADPVPRVARIAKHFYEEPCISGTNGSGAVFFTGCNLSCLFCQNYQIHSGKTGVPVTCDELAEAMLDLQEQGAHNINLVTPTPHVMSIVQSLEKARDQGLHIPVVYNTNAYENTETIEMLNGLVDIYLPDLKYYSSEYSKRFSGCQDYFRFALPAIQKMHEQAGILQLDSDGIAVKGLMIRHLVLPGCVSDSRRIMDILSESFPAETYLSVMRQYAPTENVSSLPPLNRRVTDREYDSVVDHCLSLGFRNVYVQGSDSADLSFTPEFTLSS